MRLAFHFGEKRYDGGLVPGYVNDVALSALFLDPRFKEMEQFRNAQRNSTLSLKDITVARIRLEVEALVQAEREESANNPPAPRQPQNWFDLASVQEHFEAAPTDEGEKLNKQISFLTFASFCLYSYSLSTFTCSSRCGYGPRVVVNL